MSVALHVVILALSLPAGLPWAPPGPDRRGDVIELTPRDTTAPERSREKTASREPRAAAPQPAAATAPLATRALPLETTAEPTEQPPDGGGEPVEPSGGGGDDDGAGGGVELAASLTTMLGSFDIPHEGRGLLDNDGDHLTDWEDPGCRPPPETREEAVTMNTDAMLLSDMRSDDIPRGDPDELARQRILAKLRPDRDGIAYAGGGIDATIGSDGDVRFGKARSVGFGDGGMSFDLSGIPRQRRGDRQKVLFLDATEDLRAERDDAAQARVMAKALYRLRGELDEVWRDRRLSMLQKKAVLFERLDECDLETPGGRQAAETIVAFIRAHSRPAGAQPAAQASGAGRSGTLAR